MMDAYRHSFVTWLVVCLCLTFAPYNVRAQTSTVTRATTTTSAAATRTTTAVVDATLTPVALNDSLISRSKIDATSSSGAFFNFTIPASRFTDDSDTVTLWTSVSLCAGPAIRPYNVSNSTLLEELELTATQARQSTLAGLFVSDDDRFKQPGPANTSSLDSRHIGYAQGGWTSVEINVQQSSENSSETVYIGVWPPQDTRGLSSGTYEFQIVTSSHARMEAVDYTRRARLDDTDNRRALVSSFNYTLPAPNLTAIVLPTFGSNSLPDSGYFNSSFCAIQDAWFNATQDIDIDDSETKRGTQANNVDDVRRQFMVDGLDPGTNYTVWLVETNAVNNDTAQGLTSTLFPAIKMKTKSADNCRLVSNLPFCPNVAYSIPLSSDIPTSAALSTIEQYVTPIYNNFSTMVDTFPCNDSLFGMYSYVQTCETCKEAYRDWLCAVAMPRCTDVLPDPATESRASQNGSDLTGAPTGLNVDVLPYVVNRNVNGTSPSRQAYIDEDFRPGAYGELLPCIYTCYFVTRTCPPLINWACPGWDISAQRDYGTFADSGVEGIGAAENGGAGSDGMRWGGYQRYVATDAFGNAYCNSMGVDYQLRESNSSPSSLHGVVSRAALCTLAFATSMVIALCL